MFLDGDLVRLWGSRVCHAAGTDLLVAAWRGLPPSVRAERLAANGDVLGAAGVGAPGWSKLAEGDVSVALQIARQGHGNGARSATLLEGECLVAAGAVVAGLDILRRMSQAGSVAATVALARRQHALGDHRGAIRTAAQLPMHAQAAQVAARAALLLHADAEAMRRVEPFLDGGAPIPNAMTAGAFAVLAASALARLGQVGRLRRLAETLLRAPDAPPETAPTFARTAWIGGLAKPAWERFADDQDPWSIAARLELAALAGDPQILQGLMERAGPLSGPAQDALALINGPGEPFAEPFEEGRTYHIWRTHPSRWQAWIEAATRAPGQVEVYDLASGTLPERGVVPEMAIDDGALISMVAPVPMPVRPVPGKGVWVDRQLCMGVGIGHDWLEEENKALLSAVTLAPPQEAAVWVVGADRALAVAAQGRPAVVLAPPGDPFWAGPLPQRAWPAFRVLHASPQEGWAGAAGRIVEMVGALLDGSSDVAAEVEDEAAGEGG
ncbi:MAG: hypothetical protein F4Y86_16530 [Gammaproteobacteria bacterium]|nr:hypothetical protein [Gammaproteobacteria bacterium]MYB38107.1 hypothetical protein [Gammaproteobacteria bacterium]